MERTFYAIECQPQTEAHSRPTYYVGWSDALKSPVFSYPTCKPLLYWTASEAATTAAALWTVTLQTRGKVVPMRARLMPALTTTAMQARGAEMWLLLDSRAYVSIEPQPLRKAVAA